MEVPVQGIEAGGDVGGTWNWNRYPGARCDRISWSISTPSIGIWCRSSTRVPHATVYEGNDGRICAYHVGGESFLFFRTPSPDAYDPQTGERFDDVIVIWVADDAEKQALVQDEDSPFFTTRHFEDKLDLAIRLIHSSS